jgi:hypothetical protein
MDALKLIFCTRPSGLARPRGGNVNLVRGSPLLLRWDDPKRSEGDGWAIVPWATSRRGDFGVAIQVSGARKTQAHALIEQTSSLTRRLLQLVQFRVGHATALTANG